MHIVANMPMKLLPAIAAAIVLAAPFAAPALAVDQVVKLYLCQTEHELDRINAWENSDPARYREATKNGTIMPVDAGARAGLLHGVHRQDRVRRGEQAHAREAR